MSDADLHESSSHIGVTTVESNDRRHLVTPYEDKPLLVLGPGVVACSFCGHARFRRSRLRFNDLGELLMLRYPLRCMRCSQRQYNGIHVAMMSLSPKSIGGRLAQDTPGASWQSWTGPSMQGEPATRPMTTALNPRAQRLEETTRAVRGTEAGPPVAQERPTGTHAARQSGSHAVPPAYIPSRRDDGGIW